MAMVEIDEQELEELEDANLLLNCLINAGVDNWDGYQDAIREYRKIQEMDDNE